MDSEQQKQALEEALDRWLDKKFSEVGKWTVRGIVAAALVALVYFILWRAGWQPPVP